MYHQINFFEWEEAYEKVAVEESSLSAAKESDETDLEDPETDEAPGSESGQGSGENGEVDQFDSEILSEYMNPPEYLERFGSRKDYIDTLTAYGIAVYLIKQQKNGDLTPEMLKSEEALHQWFLEEVDQDGDLLDGC